jgi:DNA repair protein RadC
MDGGHLYRLTLRVCSCGKAKSKAKHNAAAFILAHNHASGVAEPTQADEFETRCLREALQLVDIRVLDLRRARAVIGVGSEISAPLLRVRRK